MNRAPKENTISSRACSPNGQHESPKGAPCEGAGFRRRVFCVLCTLCWIVHSLPKQLRIVCGGKGIREGHACCNPMLLSPLPPI